MASSLCAAIGVTGAAAIILVMVTRTPEWYVVPEIPAEQRQAVRDDLGRMADRFTEALLHETPFTIEFSDVQLNRWITLRRHIWPAVDEAIPESWRDPLIRFENGAVKLAAEYRDGARGAVITVGVTADVQADEVVVRATECRVGSMTLPVSWMRPWVGELDVSGALDEDSPVTARGNPLDGLRLARRNTWWNGKRNFQIDDVRIEDGILRLDITPLGPAKVRSKG